MLKRRRSILIVDDDKEIRETLKESILQQFSGSVSMLGIVEAEDGRMALTKIGLQKFDLLITDLNMPKMDGKAMLAAFKSLNKDIKPTHILVLSGLLDTSHNKTSGNVTFLAKPWDEEALKQYLVSVLAEE